MTIDINAGFSNMYCNTREISKIKSWIDENNLHIIYSADNSIKFIWFEIETATIFIDYAKVATLDIGSMGGAKHNIYIFDTKLLSDWKLLTNINEITNTTWYNNIKTECFAIDTIQKTMYGILTDIKKGMDIFKISIDDLNFILDT